MSDIKINESVLAEKAQKFDKFVHFIDKNDQPISFLNPDGVLDREEGYKRNKPSRSQEILNEFEWNESWIGSGKIKERIFKVMDIADNLVNFNARIDFRKHFETDLKDYNPESEQVIYEIYKGDDDKAAFEHAIQVFGARYSVLAYLFFVKDSNKYLPASPKNFDKAFSELNINFAMANKYSWDNYCQFIYIIREIGKLIPKYMNISHKVSLLDAHSFVWIIREEKFIDWNPVMTDINTYMKPKSIIEADGSVRYQCPRCDVFFKHAERCPVCGQIVIKRSDGYVNR